MVEYKLIQCMCPNYRYCACNFDFVHWPCSKLETYTSIWQDVFAIHYTGKIQIGIYTVFLFIVFTHISSRLRRLKKALCKILVMQFLFKILKRKKNPVFWRAIYLLICMPVYLSPLLLFNSFIGKIVLAVSYVCKYLLVTYLPCKYIPAGLPSVCTSYFLTRFFFKFSPPPISR